MFSRIFNLTKREEKKETACEWHHSLDDFQAAPRLPKFGAPNIRVLIFRECDRKGKSLLFDSDAIVELKEDEFQDSTSNLAINTENAANGFSTPSRSPRVPSKYKCLKPKSDIKMLGEMMFGSVTMTYRGSIVKVHQIRTPPQLLLSKVFATRSRSSAGVLCEGNTSSSFSQSDSFTGHPRSFSYDSIAIPVMSSSPYRSHPGSAYATPSSILGNRSANCSLTSIDSLNMSGSISSLPSPSPSAGCSLNRRWHRSQMTRLDNYQNSKLKSENADDVQTVHRRQPKIGVGVVFKLWESHEEKNRVFQNFVFSHYALFEGYLQKLRIQIERSLYSKKNFLSCACEAVVNFKKEILNFYSAPRLLEPVWLNMMNIRDEQEAIAERFITVLVNAIDVFETKDANYFLSSLLTAVLMNHLAWVSTVIPSGSAPVRAFLDKHSSKTLDVLAKCHPYSPLWAQLGDLYGTVGYPPKVTKTIVVGKDPRLVRQILYILSYFIRCSDVTEYSLKLRIENDYDDYSLRHSDRLSTSSKTPTNTPNIECWTENSVDRVHTSSDQRSEQSYDLLVRDRGKTLIEEKEVFDDAEEICSCMCSILKSIDYIGEKGLKNLSKRTLNSESRHVEFERRLNAKNIIGLDNDALNFKKEIGCADKIYDVKSNQIKNFMDYPTFKCYCCPEKQKTSKMAIESSIHNERSFSKQKNEIRRNDATDISLHSDPEAKSCVCVHQDTSEYGSETISNCQSSLSRQSSCVSCLEFFKRAESRSQDLDSDYSSFTNEELGLQTDHNGIDLDLHEIVEDNNCDLGRMSSNGIKDDFDSMNLIEVPLPESDIKALPRRHFDHKVELPNFGRSLLAGYCDNFVSDFALHGLKSIDMQTIEKDLRLCMKNSVLDESVSDVAYIIADVDKKKCHLLTLPRCRESIMQLPSEEITKTEIFGSNLVSEMLDSVKGLWDLKIPFHFCLMHLEDNLKDIYNKSLVLAEYIKNQCSQEIVSRREVEEKMRLRGFDLDLLISTGSTHSPYLPKMIQ